MKAALQTFNGNYDPHRKVWHRLHARRTDLKWPTTYVMLRTGITVERLNAIEAGTVTPTDAEVERIERVLRS